MPRILFLQNAPHLVDAYAALPAEVLAVDWRVDLAALQSRYRGRSLQGNIDPAVLTAGGGGTVIQLDTVNVDIALQPTGATRDDLRTAGREAGTAFGDAFAERLGQIHRGSGGLGRPKVTVERSAR